MGEEVRLEISGVITSFRGCHICVPFLLLSIGAALQRVAYDNEVQKKKHSHGRF